MHAVIVGSAGDEQAEASGQRPYQRRSLRGQGRVIGLDAGHPGRGHRVQQGLELRGRSSLRMGQHAVTAGGPQRLDRLAEVHGAARYVERASGAEQPAKRVGGAGGDAPLDQQRGHVRPADAGASRLRLHVRVVDREPVPAHPLDHRQVALHAALEDSVQQFREAGAAGVGIETEAEQVYLACAVPKRQLDSCDEADAAPGGGARGIGDAADGVVVGQRQGGDAGAVGGLDQFLGPVAAVGAARVRVQVDRRRHRHALSSPAPGRSGSEGPRRPGSGAGCR